MLHESQKSELHLVEYQDAWPAQFLQVAEELREALVAPGFVVEHIGSTAVAGLCSKQVLDVLLGVSTLGQAEAWIPSLATLGFLYRPEYEQQIPERRYFVRLSGCMPRVHLHAVVLGGTLWRQHLHFRDSLRGSGELLHAYAALKRQLAAVHAADKAAYTEAKAPFIQQVIASCLTTQTAVHSGAA